MYILFYDFLSVILTYTYYNVAFYNNLIVQLIFLSTTQKLAINIKNDNICF